MYLWGNRPQLGFYRPNQAVARGIIGARHSLAGLGCGSCPRKGTGCAGCSMAGLGQPIAVDPKLLLWGVGALGLGMFLLGGRTIPRARRRLARRIAGVSRQFAEMGA